jgi:hypothetical protein
MSTSRLTFQESTHLTFKQELALFQDRMSECVGQLSYEKLLAAARSAVRHYRDQMQRGELVACELTCPILPETPKNSHK